MPNSRSAKAQTLLLWRRCMSLVPLVDPLREIFKNHFLKPGCWKNECLYKPQELPHFPPVLKPLIYTGAQTPPNIWEESVSLLPNCFGIRWTLQTSTWVSSLRRSCPRTMALRYHPTYVNNMEGLSQARPVSLKLTYHSSRSLLSFEIGNSSRWNSPLSSD